MSYQSELYHRRKSDGVCTDCGKVPPETDYVRCCPCLTKRRDRSHELQDQGICPHCRKRPIADDRRACHECLKAEAISSKKRADKRRQQGLCVWCGKQPAKKPRSICSECREKQAEREKRSRIGGLDVEIVRATSNRTCVLCGAESKLVIHHRDGSGQTPSPTQEYSNLVLLCKACHFKVHGVARFIHDLDLFITLVTELRSS